MIMFAIGIAIYEVLSKRSRKGYITTIGIEILSQFGLWVVAILLIVALRGLNLSDLEHNDFDALYTMGILVVVVSDIVLVVLVLMKNLRITAGHAEFLLCSIGIALAYCMVNVFQRYNLLSVELNHSYIIILCISCGGLALLFQFVQREQFQN
ncbi:hypothetical protein D3C77_469370 [compost metagenome]